MIKEHVKLATNSLRNNKVRTILTLLGIIIGVTSVTTIIGLGEGVKRQVNQQISDLGSDIITIVPGRESNSEGLGAFGGILSNSATTSQLSESDLEAVKQVENAAMVGGLMQLDGSIARDNNRFNTRVMAV